MRSLMKHKSAITKRRLIIIFILCSILTVSVVTGYSSGFVSDGNVYTPDGARIVTYADAPESGTPEDYDALSALRFTAQNIYKAEFFRGDTQGSCSAEIGMGLKYDQNVINTRVIHGDVMFQEAVSLSAAKKTANQRYIEGSHILYRPSTGVKNNLPVYSDRVVPWTVDEYYQNYGAFPNELSKYVITPKTILAIRDNNAQTAVSAISADARDADGESDDAEVDENDPNAGELACDNPQNLVRGDDGYYTFTITLDPTSASKYYRNEVKSLGGALSHPVFLFVELVIKIDENFYPVSVTTTESYDIEIKMLGALSCTGTFTETFSSINEIGEVPEQEFFRSQFSANNDGPITVEKEASDYLMEVFDPFLNGERTLDLAADVLIDDVSLKNIKLSADLKTTNVRVAYGNTYIEYAGDKVYVTLNDIKGYVSIEKAAALMQDERIKALFGGGLPDINGLLGPDALSAILGGSSVTVNNGTACVHLPFTLGEGASAVTVDAKLYIDDEKMTLVRIEGDVTLGQTRIALSAKPLDRVSFPAVGPNYKSLDGVLDLIPELLGFMSADALTVSGSASVNIVTGKDKAPVDLNVGMNGIVNLKAPDGLSAELAVNCNGIMPTVKYAYGAVYAELGNIKLRAQANELDALIATIKNITGFELPESALGFIDAIKPTTVANWLNIIQSLDVTENGLDIGLKLATVPGSISIAKSENTYRIRISIGAAAGGMSVALNADVAVSPSELRAVSVDGEYIDANELMPVLQAASNLAKSGALSADIGVELDGRAYTAKLQLDFSDKNNIKLKLTEPTLPLIVTIVGKTAYIELDGQKYGAKLTGGLDDANALAQALDKYVPENIKPMLDALLSGNLGNIDISSIIDAALGAIKSVTLDGDVLVADISYNDVSARVEAATDLGVIKITATVNGKFVKLSLANVAAQADISEPTDTSDYIQASSLVTVFKSIAPLLDAKGLSLHVSSELNGIQVGGDVAIAFDESGIAMHAALLIGDVPADIYFKDNAVYLTLANTAAVKVGATKPELDEMLAKLKSAMPDVDLSQIETAVELMFDIAMLENAEMRAIRTANGFTLDVDLANVGLDAAFALEFDTANNVFGGVTANVSALGKELNAKISVTLDNGAIRALGVDVMTADESGSLVATRVADVTLTSIDAQTVTIPQRDYINAVEFIDYVKPIRALAEQAKTAKTLELDISAYTLDDQNSQFDIAGSLKIALEKPLRLEGNITLFASSENAEKIYISLADGVLYVKTGEIMLYFDTVNDGLRLYEVISSYLPEYLNNELKKLFGLAEGYLPEGISPVTDAINRLLETENSADLIPTLFGGVNGAGSDSVLLTLLNALRISTNGGKHTLSASLLGVTLNVTPNIESDRLESVSAGVNIGSMFIGLTAGIRFSENSLAVTAPVNANEYVSIMDFADVIHNAINTVTTTDKDGNIAFEVSSFTFDYDIFAIEMQDDGQGNMIPVKDDAGRDKPLRDQNGNKVVDKHIRVTEKNGESAVKVKFVKKETVNESGETETSYKFNLEAHILLDISSLKNSAPLELDLYVINNDAYPDGIVYLDYYEQKSGHGERIKLDYTSIMQILAAAMDIIGVNDDTVEMLLGDYRLKLDKKVFESMDISGIDDLRTMLNALADAVDSGKSALADVKTAWGLVQNAGDVSELINSRERITDLLNSAMEKLKTVIGMFSSNDDDTPVSTGGSGAELYNMIVGSVRFNSGNVLDADGNVVEGKTKLQAVIDNRLATQTEGTSYVTIAQSKQGEKTVLDRISVDGLDVNTNLLRTFDMEFKAGADISVALPDGYDTTQGNRTYSDFGNIKHLLFDVMNTANLLEFDIGDANNATASNKIALKLSLIKIINDTIDIRYNAKVRIIDQGEGSNPRYKTAAAVELVFQDCTAAGAKVLPNGTTRLYFYDNVIYVKGLEWYYTKTWIGTKKWATREVNVAYTVDQLGNMMSSNEGMSRFLYEFVFYMLPLSRDFTFVSVDLQEQIANSVSSPSTGADPAPTIATAFKGYTYTDGTHSVTVGLSELAESPDSNMLGDLNVSITGKNDGDDNILDNYISNAAISTSLVNSGACTINVQLFAELRNTEVYTDPADNVPKLRSKGLSNTTDGYSLDGILTQVIPNTAWNYIWA